MSTFIEIIPEESETKKTTAIRLDDDLRLTVRFEEQGKSPDNIQLNYTGLEEGDQLVEGRRGVADPISHVNVTKYGTDARCVVGVKVYHLPNEAFTVPTPGIYWYNPITHYDPDVELRTAKRETTTGKTAAPDPRFEGAAQTFVTIFNISDTNLPAAIVAPVSFTPERLYDRLGIDPDTNQPFPDADARLMRRNHLKQLIRYNLDNPDRDLWFAGSSLKQNETDSNEERVRAYLTYLQMLTNTISVNANLDTERKFNQLVGDASLTGPDVLRNMSSSMRLNITGQDGSNNRHELVNQWTYLDLGTTGAASPYTYTKPDPSTSDATDWGATRRNSTSLVLSTGITISSETDWIDWVRSL